MIREPDLARRFAAISQDQGPLPEAELGPAQRRLWSLAEIGIDDLVGRQTLRADWRRPPAGAELDRLLTELAARHPTLLWRFDVAPGGRPLPQRRTALPVRTHDLPPGVALDEGVAALDRRPFDLKRSGVAEAWRVMAADGTSTFLLRLHPIICDGEALARLARDFFALAHGEQPAASADRADPWPAGPDEAARLAWWDDVLDTGPVASLPPPALALALGRHEAAVVLDGPTASRLQRLAVELRVDVTLLLAGALGLTLARLSGLDRLALGLARALEPRASGPSPWRDETVLPLMVGLDQAASFADFMARLRAVESEARAHALPLELLARGRWDAGGTRGSWVLPVVVERREPLPVSSDLVLSQAGARRIDGQLVLVAEQGPAGGLTLHLSAAAEAVEPALLDRAGTCLARVLDGVLDRPDAPVGDIPLLDPAELDRLSAPYPEELRHDARPVHELILAQAAAAPDETAVIFRDAPMSKGELKEIAGRIAALIAAHVPPPEARIAVAIKRSPLAMAAILGVLQSGCAFVPVDTDHPAERNDHILRDAGVALILTGSGPAPDLPPLEVPVLALDAATLASAPAWPGPVPVGERTLAYVIYTSGSTGRPKGVAVEHGPLSRHCQSTALLYEMSPASRELPVLPFSSDGGHERWMVPLMVGGSLVLPDRLWTAEETFDQIRRHGVDNASLPTSYVQQLAEHAARSGGAPPMRLYSFGGEGLPQAVFDLLKTHLNAPLLINGYGPTETIMTPLIWKVAADAGFMGAYAPIGRAVGQRRTYVLDERLRPLPPGIVGEIHIGGDGLARGYWNLPDATAERFIQDPFGPPGARLYKSGDLGTWREDGTIAFMGRVDHQVKLRGYRIELGEIERALLDQPEVAEAVVVMREDAGGKSLAGYVVARQGAAPKGSVLRQRLAGRLPDYMVPAAIVVLDSFPLNANSKVDRKRLPPPGRAEERLEPLEGALEELVGRLWRDVLGLEEVGATQNFFDLGGHSILALRILSGLREALPEGDVGIADLFNHPTIRSLAARLQDGSRPGAHETVRLQAGRPDRPTLYCFPGLLVSTREYLALVRHLGPEQPATGFVCYTLSDAEAPELSIERVTARYAEEIRRENAGRPVAFLGWSWGGLLAFETARLLRDDVDLRLIGMLDVCDMDETFSVGSRPVFAPGEREAAEAKLAAWLGQSSMRWAWQQVRERMDEEMRDQFLATPTAPRTCPWTGPTSAATSTSSGC